MDNILSSNIFQNLVSAFAGAFFAFLFIKLSESFTNLSKRRTENYNALVKTELMTVDISQQLDSIIFRLNNIISHFNETSKLNVDMLSVDKPRQMIYDKSVLYDYLNIDFANDVFSFFVHIDQNNSTILSINEFKELFQNLRMEEKITSQNYMTNMEHLVKSINEFLKKCYELKGETQSIEASCRVLMDNEMTIRMRLKNKFLKKKYKKKFDSQRGEQLEIIKKEEAELLAQKTLDKK